MRTREELVVEIASLLLNFPPHVVDKALNHTSGTIRGVAAVYNRFAYFEERRAALDAWARHMDSLVSRQLVSSNVYALHK